MQTESSLPPDVLKDRTSVTVAFCGGGSGGHLTPAIVLARAWVNENPTVRFHFLFLCSGRAIDQTILNDAKLSQCDVTIEAQITTTSTKKISLLNHIRKDFMTCRRRLKQQQPDIVVGTGGFASVAPVLAAKWLGLSPILLELNAIPGRATRWLSRLSPFIWSGWPMSPKAGGIKKAAVIPFGIPVAHWNITTGHSDHRLQKQTSRTLLIVGGSLGASRLNDIVCNALADNRRLLRDWDIQHQTGTNWEPSASQKKSCEGLNWNRHTFVPNLAEQLRTVDITISRAGAVTLAEIAHAEVASILVPLSTAADDHQTANAKCFKEVKAAFVVEEVKPSASASLSSYLSQLVSDETKREKMKRRCRKLHSHLLLQNVSEPLIALLPNTPSD